MQINEQIKVTMIDVRLVELNSELKTLNSGFTADCTRIMVIKNIIKDLEDLKKEILDQDFS